MLPIFSGHRYSRMKATNFFQALLMPFFACAFSGVIQDEGGGGTNFEAEKQKLLTEFDTKMKAHTESLLDKSEMEAFKKQYHEAVGSLTEKGFNEYKAIVDEVKAKGEALQNDVNAVKELAESIKVITKNQGNLINKMKSTSITPKSENINFATRVENLVKAAFHSDAFKNFAGGGNVQNHSPQLIIDYDGDKPELKDLINKTVVPLTNHTGDVMISEVSDVIRDDTKDRMSHVRDLISVSQTSQAQIIGGQVYDYSDALTLGSAMYAENTAVSESVFKSKENTWTLKRIGNSIRFSRRLLDTNGLKWVINHVLSRLPKALFYVEDRQLLFGDGLGNNVEGMYKVAQSFDLTPNAYVATAFSTVATYNAGDQALITFASAHSMRNGDSLTIANATESTYNATHTAVEVVNATQVVIDLTYVIEAAVDVAAWTGSSQSIFYQSIDNAQEYDVNAVTEALLVSREYGLTGHVVNPQQTIQMGLLKATDANYLNIARDSNGRVVSVNGKPMVETTAMPAGKFLSGDFSRNGVELYEFRPLNIQFVVDVDAVKSNEIVAVIDEEIIFPVYNPTWFIYGKYADAKTELETPAS